MTNNSPVKLSDLTPKAQLRKFILDAFIRGEIGREEAIDRLNISSRQFIRIVKNYQAYGLESLVHKLCNRPSNHSYNPEIKDKVVGTYVKKYNGFNYIHASEKLEELDQLSVHPTTLRNWLLSRGITRRKYRSKTYHKRREPCKQFGELVQLDGSFHDWFGDGKEYCLMHMVDDATKTSLAMLCDGETTNSALAILYKWCELYGIPRAIYSDRDSVYKVNEAHQRLTIEEELAGINQKVTEFGKVCERLGIQQIFAYSAQAKGRVERKHQIYQDRMLKEIKLFNLTSMEQVNEFLLKPNGFIEKINAKFTIPAAEASNSIKVPKSRLIHYFTIDQTRVVRNDYTIQFKGKVFQLNRHRLLRAKAKVVIKTYLDGKIFIYLGKDKLEYSVVEDYQRPEAEVAVSRAQPAQSASKQETVSPWRQFKPKKSSNSSNRRSTAQYLDYLATSYS